MTYHPVRSHFQTLLGADFTAVAMLIPCLKTSVNFLTAVYHISGPRASSLCTHPLSQGTSQPFPLKGHSVSPHLESELDRMTCSV